MPKEFDKVVPDTSIIIGGVLSDKLDKEIKTNSIIIHNAVLVELEHQANKGRAIGFLGIDELKKLKKFADESKFSLRFSGKRPSAAEIKYASLGEIDSLIRELAYDEDATLITGDKVQAGIGEAKGMSVLFFAPKIVIKPLIFEKYFDETTMSVHLRENVVPYAKRGFPGKWDFVELETKSLKQDFLQEVSREIIEETKRRKDSYLEIEREGSTIVQLGYYRIVIVKPPFADGWEITAVKPIKQLELDDYKLSSKLKERIEKYAEGVLIAGSPGHGKTTMAAALAKFYASKNKTVKTIEAPRDLYLPDNITQLAISHGDPQEIHDILLLSRPDYTIFDEMRNVKDFTLFSDLRLAGIGLAGVIHATNPIDAIQRFVGKIELGMIPHVIDTVIFIKNGAIDSVLSLEMTVKVPSGMTEADLARPVIVVSDFETGKMLYEIYTFGEETVVVPISEVSVYDPTRSLAAKQLEKELLDYVSKAKVNILPGNKAEVFVPSKEISSIIGRQGKNIEKIEKRFGLRIDVKELSEIKRKEKEGKSVRYKINETSKFIAFKMSPRYAGEEAEIFVENHFLFTSTVGKRGDIKVHKKSKLGQTLLSDLDQGKNIEIRI